MIISVMTTIDKLVSLARRSHDHFCSMLRRPCNKLPMSILILALVPEIKNLLEKVKLLLD